MIYLASPYSHPDLLVQQRRFELVKLYVEAEMCNGSVLFSPIVYGHQFSLDGFPTNFEYWAAFNDHMLKTSTAVHVLQLPGWAQSRGVHHEVALAEQHNIPVDFMKAPKYASV